MSDRVLSLGTFGADVQALQSLLVRCHVVPTPRIDGVFGDVTARAVRNFQLSAHLEVDGIVGPKTWDALRDHADRTAAEPDKSAMAGTPTPPAPRGSVELLPVDRAVSEIIWHCTATPEGRDYTVDDIRAWHKARGWSDIGYHYVVYRDGSIHAGRPVGKVGAHVEGHNTGTIGCVYVGGVSAGGSVAKDTRTADQRAAMLWLTQALLDLHPGIHKISGHNQYANKACPSFHVPSDPLGQVKRSEGAR